MTHFLSIEQLNARQLNQLIDSAVTMKATRAESSSRPLSNQTWAMIFTKASTRTRVSFEVGIRELGGKPIFLSGNDLQLGRGEPIKDTARVLGRMVHGAVIRTFDQADVVEFAKMSGIPTINALTDEEHPCQILADLLTIREHFGSCDNQKVAFVGDGFSNMTISWMWAAKILGFELRIGCPDAYSPSPEFLAKLDAPNVIVSSDPVAAVKGAAVINTDVWLSMGQEGQGEKEAAFGPYQVNEQLLASAAPGHVVFHCLPAYRGKEISEETLEKHASSIFQQAENRLHAQKAVLAAIAR